MKDTFFVVFLDSIMMEAVFQVKAQNHCFSYRILAFSLCFVLVFTTVFRPVKAKAAVPALPFLTPVVVKTVSYYGAVMGGLNLIKAAGEAFESVFGNSVYEFWEEHFTSKEAYDGFTSRFDSTTASSSIAVTGFSGLYLDEKNYPYSTGLNALLESSPENTLSLLKHLTPGEKVLVVGMNASSPYEFLGIYFTDSGLLRCGVFTNPFGAVHSSYLGVYSRSDLELIVSDPFPWLRGSYSYYYALTFYSMEYALAYSGWETQTCVVLDFDTVPDTSGWLAYFKESENISFTSKDRLRLASTTVTASVWNFRSKYAPSHAISWDNSRIVVQPSEVDETSRPVSLLQTINQYNNQYSIADNSTNVNYYINPTGTDVSTDTLFSPALYDEETLIYTDPVTGTEYLTNGWTYDYLTRCYTLDMADDTFTIGNTVIDTIKLTYGDDVLTVDHYASGALIQSDSYDYVMVSGSECSINGHAYTYETLKEPTCTSLGERKYTCSVCGDEYAEDVPANGHTKVFSVMSEPTCTSTGIGVYTCSVCGMQASETIPATDHTPVVLEKVESEYDEHGTLITPGYTLYECTKCGTQYTESDDLGVENESWFSWIGSLFRTLLSSIVNGFASGVEWLFRDVLGAVFGWIIKSVEWVFGLFNGEHLTTLFDWFSFEDEIWANKYSDPALFKEVA